MIALRVGLLGPCLAAVATAQPPQPDLAKITQPPLGMPAMPLPEGRAPTPSEFALGAMLFADPILSVDRSVSCASCHPAEAGFASPEPFPPGARGRRARRHAPALFNRGWGKTQLWDGRAPTLEQQVLMPIADPDEMALSVPEALQRLRESETYSKLFQTVDDAGVSEASLSRALAGFVRGIVSGDSPVDRFHAGKIDSLTREEKAGLWIFESKGRCWQCHSPPLFTDESFHNTGIGVVDGRPEEGRAAITKDPDDRGRFKTPTLREVAHSAPYMHDGSLLTLEDVVEFYRRGGNANDDLDPKLLPLQLTDKEVRSLIAFLRALSRH